MDTRIFVHKKEQFQVESESLAAELRQSLSLKEDFGLTKYNLYDIFDADENDIELLNVTVETSAQNLQSEFEEKLDYYINDLKKQLLEDSRTTDLIENTKEELSGKLDSILDSQSNITEQANVISAKIATFGDELKNYVQSACENVIDNESKEVLNSLGDIVAKADELNLNLEDKIKSNSEEVKSSLEDVVAKADKISLNLELNSSDLKSSLEDIVAKADELNSNLEDKIKLNGEELKNSLDVLSNKVDIMASDTSFDDLYERFEDFSETEDKLSEMISALHQKVDAIAMDETTFDIEEEIDDIKELIFEQRKYFEASSDDKASAIDKYLNDVLLKLDNVDLEKNAEDIKETIMNALVSLVDQISFVEETEDIKDFVEEKTDAINQSLIEVQNQLKQIASSDDDFSYSYTLQDVESDIAKLRLAISHLSGNDFESLSDDIKKIVSSVEGLESTLTQEQAVDLKRDIEKLNEEQLVTFRRDHVGFIFQSFHLMGTLNAVENVALPLSFRGVPRDVRVRKANEMLDLVKLGKHKKHLPNQMSGGQQQRVGVARALVVDPDIIFADEPTGNLDSHTSEEVMELMQRVVREQKKTLVMVTHDDHLATYADRVFHIWDGRIIKIEDNRWKKEKE